VTGFVGRSSSFEITINDQLVFSKLKSGGFPIPDEVIGAVKHAASGGDPGLLQNVEKQSCTIL